MGRRSAGEWTKLVSRWRRSGLTASEFASKAGLKASTLSYWAWRLTKGDTGKHKRTGPRRRPPKKRAAVVASRSLQLVELPAPMTVSSPEALEVMLGGDVRVRVPVGFDPDTLMRVVRALEAAR